MNSGIYIILNKENGKFYIGSSLNLSHRLDTHKSDLRLSKHHSKHLQRAWDKHGKENFLFQQVEECLPEDCIEREQVWLDFHQTYNKDIGYNIVKFAGRTDGYKHDDVARKKMSDYWKEKWKNMTEDQRNRSVLRTSKSRLGMKNSDSHMKAIVAHMSKGINSPENLAKRSKPVQKYSLDGNFIEEYPSITKARDSVTNKKSIAAIKHACLNFNRKSYGFRWKFKN